MNIATVVEGPTDRMVLEAVLDHIIPGEHRYFPLQPIVTFGETGAGWKGVRRWCQETWQRGSTLSRLLSAETGTALDLLVIQVDADIADESDLQENDTPVVVDVLQPCPPVAATATQLKKIILNWLHLTALPSQVIVAIPVQDTENWTFAALFPNDPLCGKSDYECMQQGRQHPGYCLTLKQYGKLLRRTAGKIKKPRRDYERATSQITARWEDVCRVCSQAARFTVDIQACIYKIEK